MSSENTSDTGTRSAVASAKILVFHKIQPEFSFGSTNFSPRRLDKLLKDLTERGYSFETVDKVVSQPAEKQLAVSFDDGYAHLRRVLPPLMDKYGLKPTVFIPTAYIGRHNDWDYSYFFRASLHLDEPSIRELTRMGVEFASHGHSHRPLIRLSDEKLQLELETSRKTLQDLTGRPVTKISYPFGRVNRRVIDMAAAAGYEHGFTMDFPVISDHHLARGRLAVYGFDTQFTIRQKISGGSLYSVERMKAAFTNRLSAGTGLYRRLTGR